MSDNYKTRLNSINNPHDSIIFQVSPDLNESRSVNYKSLDLLHMPGSIFAYGSSGTRTFNMVVKLISRTIEEATQNSRDLQLLRSWTLPYFGKSTTTLTTKQIEANDKAERKDIEKSFIVDGRQSELGLGKNLLGQPPEVLNLNAYSNFELSSTDEFSGNISNVPVVITQLGNNYPQDVTYFPTRYGEPFPVIMTVDILLTETHSPKEYSNFNLADYKEGRLSNF